MSSGVGIQQMVRDQIPRDNERTPFPLSASARIVTSDASSACGLVRDFSTLFSCAAFHHHRARQLRRRPSDGRPGQRRWRAAVIACKSSPIPYFEDVVAGAGLELLPIGTREDYIRLSQHPDLWHPIRGPKLVLTHASADLLRPMYDLLIANYAPGETVFCAHAIDLASRVAGEKLGVPVASIDFAPSMLWSVYDSPRLKGALLGPRVPKWLKRVQFWAADTIVAQRLLGSRLESLAPRAGSAAGAANFFALAAHARI